MNLRSNFSIPAWARPLFDSYRYKVLYGGRGGAKTTTFAHVAICRAAERRTKFVCGREFQNSLDDSVKSALESIIIEHNLTDFFKIGSTEITAVNGSSFVFKGLARNIMSIKGWNDVDVFWGEEADVFSADSLRLLLPTIRKEGSELWFSFNRKDRDDPIDRMFLGAFPPPDSFVLKVNYSDNPFHNAVMEQERKTALLLDHERYAHIWEGEPDECAGIFFRSEWIKYYDKAPATLNIFGASDYALTEGGGDWTVHGVFGVDELDNIYLLDFWRGQTDSLGWINEFLRLGRKWKPMYWFEEGGSIIKALNPLITKMMLESGTYFVRQNVEYGGKNKEARAQGIRARMAMGKVFLPRGASFIEHLVNELMRFPQGKHDDQVDVLSLVGLGLDSVYAPKINKTVTNLTNDTYSDYKSNDDAWSYV